jgi:hypothetical protein
MPGQRLAPRSRQPVEETFEQGLVVHAPRFVVNLSSDFDLVAGQRRAVDLRVIMQQSSGRAEAGIGIHGHAQGGPVGFGGRDALGQLIGWDGPHRDERRCDDQVLLSRINDPGEGVAMLL